MNWTTITNVLVAICIILVFFVIILCLFLYRLLKKNRENLSADILDRLETPNSRLREKINSIVEEALAGTDISIKSSKKDVNIDYIIEKAAEKAADRAADMVFDELRKEQERQEPKQQQQQPVNPKGNVNVYYATAVDNGVFCKVTDEFVRGESVFKFYEVSKGSCSFEVCEEAFAMVLNESTYLSEACNLSRKGSTKVINQERGIAIFEEDTNKWIVSKKANVNFE